MKQTRRRVAQVGLALFALLLSNYVGGVVGYNQGYGTALALSGDDALLKVAVLKDLRAGRTDTSIAVLESQLDSEIAGALFGTHSYNSPYNLLLRLAFGNRPVENNAWALRTVLEYREQFPFTSGDPQLRDRMLAALSSYRDAPRPNSSRAVDR